jgi:hypothetical protein
LLYLTAFDKTEVKEEEVVTVHSQINFRIFSFSAKNLEWASLEYK